MQTKGQKAAKIIGIVLALLLVAGLVAVLYRFTNGFNEGFKTFYVEHDGERILSSESKMILETDTTYRFDVKYTFDTPQSDTKDYSVKIMPNAERDFDFTVDGQRHLYSKQGDMTSASGSKSTIHTLSSRLRPNLVWSTPCKAVIRGRKSSSPRKL